MNNNSDGSAFQASIHALGKSTGSVPIGWRMAYKQFLVKLNAVKCPMRAGLTLQGPVIDHVGIYIIHTGADRVVSGVVRWLQSTTAKTCQLCGHGGRFRALAANRTAVLCARCAAPRLLRAGLRALVCEMDRPGAVQGPLITSFDLLAFQLRPIIPKDAWRMKANFAESTVTYYVLDSKLVELRPRLDWLLEKLNEALLEEEVE